MPGRMDETSATAVVMGDIDVVRPLAAVGVRCAVFAPPGEAGRHSRHVHEVLDWTNPWSRPEEAVETVRAFAARQASPPVILVQTDATLLAVSRLRSRLEGVARLALPDPEVVEDLVDKLRFARLAHRIGLPVPESRVLVASRRPPDLDLRYPIVLKPATRQDEFEPLEATAKVLHVASPDDLQRTWSRISDLGVDLLAQEAVSGPESAVESYHAYVDGDGEIAADFTGRKIRTMPARYGHTTALEITAEADVLALGREVLERIGLRGVVKLDFKRGLDRRLNLLEANPRHSLWHSAAAVAGVNLPALVHADLTGRARPAAVAARPGVTWCRVPGDLAAAREQGMGVAEWMRWLRRCDVVSALSREDPRPWIQGRLWPGVRRRLTKRRNAS